MVRHNDFTHSRFNMFVLSHWTIGPHVLHAGQASHPHTREVSHKLDLVHTSHHNMSIRDLSALYHIAHIATVTCRFACFLVLVLLQEVPLLLVGHLSDKMKMTNHVLKLNGKWRTSDRWWEWWWRDVYWLYQLLQEIHWLFLCRWWRSTCYLHSYSQLRYACFHLWKYSIRLVSLNHLYTKNRSGPFVVTLVLRFSQSLWNHL